MYEIPEKRFFIHISFPCDIYKGEDYILAILHCEMAMVQWLEHLTYSWWEGWVFDPDDLWHTFFQQKK